MVKSFDLIPSLEFVIYVEFVSAEAHPKIKSISFQELLASGTANLEKNKAEIERRTAAINEEDLCTIIYTSGTTVNPKVVMITHENLVSCCEAGAKALNTENSLELSFLPLSHILERVVYYTEIASGSTIAYVESMDTIAANMLEVKPTALISLDCH